MAKPEKITLTIEQQTQLESLDEQIEWLETEITRAESVGLDVEEMKTNVLNARKVRDGLLREYGRV